MLKMKKIICMSIIFVALGVIFGIIFYNKVNIVAQVNIWIPSLTEDPTSYTYFIYKKSKNEFTYKKVETKKWIEEIISEKTVNAGIIKNKEQLNIIQKDIEKYEEDFPIAGYSNISIYYKNEKLNTLGELSERLF